MDQQYKFYMHVADTATRQLSTALEMLIMSTSTGEVRNALTDANIHIMQVMEVLKFVRDKS